MNKPQNTNNNSLKLESAIMLYWIESESGMGFRPDGISLHLNKTDAAQYVQEYWNEMPDTVPNTYSRPMEPITVQVKENIYSIISKSKNGIRLSDSTLSEYKNLGDLVMEKK